MQTFESPPALRGFARSWRDRGESVALVPTMGDLHDGHLALVDEALRLADRVIVSIFVNPLQFGPEEDYTGYPRTPEQDRARLRERGVDVLFAPGVDDLYPHGLNSRIEICAPGLDDILCGADRPGHFAGVARVVTKLLNIAEPDFALFGEKDYQQMRLIECLVGELDFPATVVSVPTVREADGLALSSRNRYLDGEQRARAAGLYRVLREVADRLRAGETHHEALAAKAREELVAQGFAPDYVAIRRAADLGEPGGADPPGDLRVLAAARLGRARLIDNVAVDDHEPS